jgi:hypothetical protein
MMQLYKVISKDNKSFNGGDFDWTLYLPNGDQPGEWAPHIETIENCKVGYHVTPYPCMWYETDCRVFEVETRGEVHIDEIGTLTKLNCQSIRLIKEVEYVIDDKSNSGNRNSGYLNSGNCNSGNRNSGNYNSGNYNSGYLNSGNCNSGHHNSGNYNSGNYNSGNYNSGNYNSGNRHTGNFNTGKPKYYELFNKPIKAEIYENIYWPSWFIFKLSVDGYKQSWAKAFDSIVDAIQIENTINLPNFDYVIFEEITGISKEMIDKKLEQLKV